jgi:hypothetical protein
MITFLMSFLLLVLTSNLLQETIPPQSLAERWSVLRLIEHHQNSKRDLQAQDVYKLLYQAHFGVGHILTDTAAVTSHLLVELGSLDTTIVEESLVERISTSGKMVRINLRPFKQDEFAPDLLVQLMFRSADAANVDTLQFYREWNEFGSLVRFGILEIPVKEVEQWNRQVIAGKLEPVHHSEKYRQANKPAYRVVRREFIELPFRLLDE